MTTKEVRGIAQFGDAMDDFQNLDFTDSTLMESSHLHAGIYIKTKKFPDGWGARVFIEQAFRGKSYSPNTAGFINHLAYDQALSKFFETEEDAQTAGISHARAHIEDPSWKQDMTNLSKFPRA